MFWSLSVALVQVTDNISIMMNKNKPMSEIKCQQVLWNLLELFEGKDSMPASVLVGELMQTKRCDGVLSSTTAENLKALRSDYTGALDSAAVIDRIHSGNVTAQDEIKALKVIAHYRTHTTNQLYSGLYFWKKVQYQTLFKAERNVAALGLLGLGVGGSRAMYKIAKASTEYMKKL